MSNKSYNQTFFLRFFTFYSIVDDIILYCDNKFHFNIICHYEKRIRRRFNCHMQIYEKSVFVTRQKYLFNETMSKRFFNDCIKTRLRNVTCYYIRQKQQIYIDILN